MKKILRSLLALSCLMFGLQVYADHDTGHSDLNYQQVQFLAYRLADNAQYLSRRTAPDCYDRGGYGGGYGRGYNLESIADHDRQPNNNCQLSLLAERLHESASSLYYAARQLCGPYGSQQGGQRVVYIFNQQVQPDYANLLRMASNGSLLYDVSQSYLQLERAMY